MIQTVMLFYAAPGDPAGASEFQGKFIQLTRRGKQYLIFAVAPLHRFHSQILAHFAADRNIAHRWAGDQILEIKSPELTVLGGGKFRVNTTDRTLELWDSSQAYGRFGDRGLPEAIASAGHAWSGFEIRIA